MRDADSTLPMVESEKIDAEPFGAEPIADSVFRIRCIEGSSPTASLGGQTLSGVQEERGGVFSIPIPRGTEGRELNVSAIIEHRLDTGTWIVRPSGSHERRAGSMDEEAFRVVTGGMRNVVPSGLASTQIRRWSYGDVENNGIYYHPSLTHYAHQVFEEFFLTRVGMNYTDLSRDDNQSEQKRKARNIERMAFPVEWLHQYMKIPMAVGDTYKIGIDTVGIDSRRIGVRAFVFDSHDKLAAIVIWIRCAVLLLQGRTVVNIPSWFPRQ